jgi:hypothetical protein
VLAIVSELHYRRFDAAPALAEGRRRLQAKLQRLRDFEAEPKRRHPFDMFDFGIRRRFSGEWQREVVSAFRQALPRFFKGTSNVYLAAELDLVPIGTMAHEYLQTYQALGVRLRDHQKAALEDWVQEYRGDLGTALTDVVGMRAFLRDFDLYFAKLFDNCEWALWTSNCEYGMLWTWTQASGGKHKAGRSSRLVFQRIHIYVGGVSSGGQLACPPERVSVGEPVRQPAETAACGGRPQAEERVPVPLGARVARTGWLSTGGRVRRGLSRLPGDCFRSCERDAIPCRTVGVWTAVSMAALS